MATEEPFFGRKENIKAIWNEIHQVNSTGLVCSKYGFFSKSGYKEINESFKKQLIFYKLEDLYQDIENGDYFEIQVNSKKDVNQI